MSTIPTTLLLCNSWIYWTASILYSMSARKHMHMGILLICLYPWIILLMMLEWVILLALIILAVHSTLHLEKPRFVKKVVSSRKLNGIDVASFRRDIEGSVLLQHREDLHAAVNNCDEVLRSLLDKHAPMKERVVTVRPSAPWYTVKLPPKSGNVDNFNTNGDHLNFHLIVCDMCTNVALWTIWSSLF